MSWAKSLENTKKDIPVREVIKSEYEASAPIFKKLSFVVRFKKIEKTTS